MGVELPTVLLKTAIPDPDVVVNHAAVAATTVIAVVSAIPVTETNDVARFAARLRISH